MQQKPTLKRHARPETRVHLYWNDEVDASTRASILKRLARVQITHGTRGKYHSYLYILALPGKQDLEQEYRDAKRFEKQIHTFNWKAFLETKKEKAILLLIPFQAQEFQMPTFRMIQGQQIKIFPLIIDREMRKSGYTHVVLSKRTPSLNQQRIQGIKEWFQ